MAAESDAYDFRMIFGSLCAFIPNCDWSSSPNEVTVALRDLTQPRQVEIPQGFLKASIKHHVVPHFPFLLYQADQLDEGASARKTDLTFKRAFASDPKRLMGLSYLKKEEIMVGIGEKEPPRGKLKVEFCEPLDPVKPQQKEKRSLWFLANLERAATRSGMFNQELLGDGKQVGRASLHCHFSLTHGSLHVGNLADGEWQFHRSPTPKQKLASNVVLEYAGITEPVVLWSRCYDEVGWRKIMQFRPADADKPQVEVRVFNRELSCIFRPAPGGPQVEDRDFAHYYEMSKDYRPSKKRPFPQDVTQAGGLSHPDGCSPGGYNGKG